MLFTHVNHDQSISFYYNRSGVDKVEVAGTFSQWSRVDMELIEKNVWFHQTPPLETGDYQYKFIIDHNWFRDPTNLMFDHKTENSVIHIGLEKGHTVHSSFFSPALGQDKMYAIYFPPTYPFEKEHYYPTLYLMGGLFDYELSWIKDGNIVEIINSLLQNNEVEEMIIVMPDKDNSCFADGDWTRYSTYLTRDLLTHCETEFRCHAAQRKRAIEGLSLGAGWAFRLGVNYPDIFSSVSALSGFLPDDVKQDLEQNVTSISENEVRFRLFCGDQESDLGDHMDWLQKWLTDNDITCEFYQDHGIHRWPLWQRGIKNSLIFHNYSFSRSETE